MRWRLRFAGAFQCGGNVGRIAQAFRYLSRHALSAVQAGPAIRAGEIIAFVFRVAN